MSVNTWPPPLTVLRRARENTWPTTSLRAAHAAALVFAVTTYIASISPLPLDDILFECISAFSTVGLSTGITADLPPSALIALCALMFIGRVGTITVATALALGGRERPYRYPEENPIVG